MFFCLPAASLTEVAAVENVVADDLEQEIGRSAAAGIDVDCSDSTACMVLIDDFAQVDVSEYNEMCARQKNQKSVVRRC